VLLAGRNPGNIRAADFFHHAAPALHPAAESSLRVTQSINADGTSEVFGGAGYDWLRSWAN
jgi:hypothetical protein